MATDAEEIVLPYTPSNTGRRARVGYLGFEGLSFNDLWPLFVGVAISVGLSLDFFVGGGAADIGWLGKSLVASAPFAGAFLYLRVLVVGRPPHFKADLWASAAGLRFSLRAFPGLYLDASGDCGPARAADGIHPRIRAR